MAYQSEIEKLEQRFSEKPEQWFAAVADAYRKSGQIDRALEVLNAWIDARPNYTSGHIVRGRCHLDQQNDVEALAAFQRVLELDPENIIAVKSLGEIAERQGQRDTAREWVGRLLEIDPMNEEGQAALDRLSRPPEEAMEASGAEGAEGPEGADEVAEAAEVGGEEPLPGTVRERTVSFADIRMPAEGSLPAEGSPPAEEPVEAEAAPEPEPEAEPAPPPAAPAHPPLAATVQEPAIVIPESTPAEEAPAVEEEAEAPAEPDFEIERAAEGGSGVTLEVEPIRLSAPVEESVHEEAVVSDVSPRDETLEVTPAMEEETVEEAVEEMVEPADEVVEEAVEPAAVADEEFAVVGADDESQDAGTEISEEPIDLESPEVVEGLETVGGMEPAGLVQTEETASPTAEELGATSFDEELAWDAGERTSRSVSRDDLQAAQTLHDEEVEVPAHSLPGIETEEVPEVGVDGRDTPPTEGLMGIDTIPRAQPAPAPEPEVVAEEVEASSDAPIDSEETLPLIMPEEVTPESVGSDEPEPVLTETMARLYVKQGHYREAQAIYEELLTRNPGDPQLRARLDEVRQHVQAAAPGGAPAPAGASKQARYSVAVTGGKSIRTFFAELAGVTQPAPAPAGAEAPPADSGASAPTPAPAPAPAPSEPSAPPAAKSGFSFDEFFGEKGDQAAKAPPAAPQPEAPKEDGDEDDFRDWLQRLKT